MTTLLPMDFVLAFCCYDKIPETISAVRGTIVYFGSLFQRFHFVSLGPVEFGLRQHEVEELWQAPTAYVMGADRQGQEQGCSLVGMKFQFLL